MQFINKQLNKKAVENMEAMEMNNQELCILLDSILALLETDNKEKAKQVIKNGIKRIDKGMTSSSAGITQDKDD